MPGGGAQRPLHVLRAGGPGAGFLDATASGGVAYGPVNFEIVDPSTIKSLRAKLPPFGRMMITTRTQAFGYTGGGGHITSNVFEFGILACRGCLINFDTDRAVEPQPNCFGQAGVGAQTRASMVRTSPSTATSAVPRIRSACARSHPGMSAAPSKLEPAGAMETPRQPRRPVRQDLVRVSPDVGSSSHDLGQTSHDLYQASRDLGRPSQGVGTSSRDLGPSAEVVVRPVHDLGRAPDDTEETSNDVR